MTAQTDRRTYTDPSVIEGIAAGASWADPEMDPTRIDWSERQAEALIPFEVDERGPVNPCEDTDVWYGRNELGHWGEQACADALVWATLPDLRRFVLMVERADGHGWALPGGYSDPGESLLTSAVRELEEETGLVLPHASWTIGEPRYVPDPRASRQSWMVTAVATPSTWHVEQLPHVEGRDDARRAAWILADTYPTLTSHLARVYGGQVFAAHVNILVDALAGR